MQFVLGVPELISTAAAVVLILFLLKSAAAKFPESPAAKGLAYIVA